MNIHPLAAELVSLKERCMRAGLFGTANALEAAVRAVGWELAELMAGETWTAATEHYKKHRKAVQQLIKKDRKPFAFPPSHDMRHPGNWHGAHWRWFVEEWKRRSKVEGSPESSQKL